MSLPQAKLGCWKFPDLAEPKTCFFEVPLEQSSVGNSEPAAIFQATQPKSYKWRFTHVVVNKKK